MAREPGFVLYESVWRSSAVLSQRARGAFLSACAAFYFDGVEPQGLPKDASLLFAGTRPRIERARTIAISKRNEAATDSAADCYAQVSGSVDASIIAPLSAQTSQAPTHMVPRVGDGVGAGVSDGVHLSQRAICMAPSLDHDQRLSDALDEAERRELDLFLLSEESEHTLERWVSRWLGNGWADANGDPMDELVSYHGETVPRWVSMMCGYHDGMVRKSEHNYQRWE